MLLKSLRRQWARELVGLPLLVAISLLPLAEYQQAHAVIVDSNGDGISDGWAQKYGFLPGEEDLDMDFDGRTALQEALAGTDPNDANSRLEMDVLVGADGLPTAELETRLHKRYQIQISTDSFNWSPVGESFEGTGARLSIGNLPPLSGAQFYRLAVLEDRDRDNDGVSDWEEAEFYGTDISNPDTDGDGALDGEEILAGTDPNDPLSVPLVLVKISGDQQVLSPGQQAPEPLGVLVTQRDGTPIAGKTLEFQLVQDDGRFLEGSSWVSRSVSLTTNSGGICRIDYQAGSDLVDGQVRGVVSGLGGGQVTFSLPVRQEVDAPKFSHSSMTLDYPIWAQIFTETEGAVIHYTFDGSLPSSASPVYDPLQPLLIEQTRTIRARAQKDGQWSADTSVTWKWAKVRVRNQHLVSTNSLYRYAHNPVERVFYPQFAGIRDFTDYKSDTTHDWVCVVDSSGGVWIWGTGHGVTGYEGLNQPTKIATIVGALRITSAELGGHQVPRYVLLEDGSALELVNGFYQEFIAEPGGRLIDQHTDGYFLNLDGKVFSAAGKIYDRSMKHVVRLFEDRSPLTFQDRHGQYWEQGNLRDAVSRSITDPSVVETWPWYTLFGSKFNAVTPQPNENPTLFNQTVFIYDSNSGKNLADIKMKAPRVPIWVTLNHQWLSHYYMHLDEDRFLRSGTASGLNSEGTTLYRGMFTQVYHYSGGNEPLVEISYPCHDAALLKVVGANDEPNSSFPNGYIAFVARHRLPTPQATFSKHLIIADASTGEIREFPEFDVEFTVVNNPQLDFHGNKVVVTRGSPASWDRPFVQFFDLETHTWQSSLDWSTIGIVGDIVGDKLQAYWQNSASLFLQFQDKVTDKYSLFAYDISTNKAIDLSSKFVSTDEVRYVSPDFIWGSPGGFDLETNSLVSSLSLGAGSLLPGQRYYLRLAGGETYAPFWKIREDGEFGNSDGAFNAKRSTIPVVVKNAEAYQFPTRLARGSYFLDGNQRLHKLGSGVKAYDVELINGSKMVTTLGDIKPIPGEPGTEWINFWGSNQVAAGARHNIILKDGHLYVAGSGAELGTPSGNLPIGATVTSPAGLSEAVGIDAGGPFWGSTRGHSIAYDKGSRIWTWGANNLGQLGIGSTATTTFAVNPTGVSVTFFSAPSRASIYPWNIVAEQSVSVVNATDGSKWWGGGRTTPAIGGPPTGAGDATYWNPITASGPAFAGTAKATASFTLPVTEVSQDGSQVQTTTTGAMNLPVVLDEFGQVWQRRTNGASFEQVPGLNGIVKMDAYGTHAIAMDKEREVYVWSLTGDDPILGGVQPRRYPVISDPSGTTTSPLAWRQSTFGQVDAPDHEDFDGDGVDNLTEYKQGTNAADPELSAPTNGKDSGLIDAPVDGLVGTTEGRFEVDPVLRPRLRLVKLG